MACKVGAYFLVTILLCSVFSFSYVQGQDQDYSYRENPLLVTADSLINFEKWDEAITTFIIAKNNFDQLENTPASIYTQGKIAFCYMQKGDYSTAFTYLSRALVEGEVLLEKDIYEVCNIYSYLGTYYLERDQPSIDSSYLAHQKAIKICEKRLPDINRDLARAYAGMGRFYYRRDEFLQSIYYYKKSYIIQEQILAPNDQQLGITSQRLGISYRGAGETFRSRDYLKRAIKIFESNEAFSPSFDYAAFNGLANTHFDLKEYDVAQPLYEMAIAIGSKSRSSQSLIIPLNNLASTYAYTNRPDSANILFHSALNINLSSDITSGYGLWTTYLQMGDYFLRYNKLDSAKYCFKISVEIVENMPLAAPNAKASSYAWLARAEAKSGNIDNGLNFSQRAIIELESSFNDDDLFSNPDLSKTLNSDLLYAYLEVKADIFFLKYQQTNDLHDLVESLNLYLLVDELTDEIRNGPYTDRTKLLVARSFKHTASSALRNIQILFEQTKDKLYTSMAFDFMEKNRYAELYSNISKLSEISNLGIEEDSIYDLEHELIFEIATKRGKLAEDLSDSLRIRFETELFNFENNYEELQSAINDELPTYQQVNYDNLITLAEVENSLDDKSQIIEYFWGERSISILSITKSGSRLSEISITDELRNNISSFQKHISQPDFNRNLQDLFSEYLAVSRPLYKSLLGNLVTENISEIVLSLDGSLALLPFESLIISDEGASFQSADYLINHMDLQYAYSINLLLKNSAPAPIENPSLLAFAYSNGNELSDSPSRNEMNEIPYSAKEIESIRESFNSKNNKILSGELATETRFKELAGDYDIIHLAVHGIGDTINTIDSRLIFKTSPELIDDGNLYAHELYTMRFKNPRLAVLSACETGIGKEYPGEGIFSMARGFAYVGFPTTVMSFWDVSDTKTTEIMVSFYENLKKGKSISRALRESKLEYIDQNSNRDTHPYFWAAFVAIGDSKSVMLPRSNIVKYAILIILLFLVIGFWTFRTSIMAR